MLNNNGSILKNIPDRLLSLKLSGMMFCVDMKDILTIITPATAKFIEAQNLSNKNQVVYKNEIFQLISLDIIINGSNKRDRNLQYLILIDCHNKKAAFYVDEIVEFIILNEYNFNLSKKNIPGKVNGFYNNIIYENREVPILNLKRVIESKSKYKSKYHNLDRKERVNA